MARFENVGGYILAGGTSSRMGRDKGMLEIGGAPLIVRAARLLDALVGQAMVIGPPERYAALGVRTVEDDCAGLGPLGGIATALRLARHEWNLILGCDMPFLTAAWLAFLVERAFDSAAGVVLPERDRGPEPLCAMYARRCRPALVAALERGERKLTEVVRKLEVEIIPSREWKVFDAEGLLFENMNTPADYEAAKARGKP